MGELRTGHGITVGMGGIDGRRFDIYCESEWCNCDEVGSVGGNKPYNYG